jgi:dipeptidyl aminopeptidase/acylaminoacyl peptidase
MRAIVSGLLFYLCSSLTFQAIAEPLTLHDLTKIRQVVAAVMSPNGKHIAFTLSLPSEVTQNSGTESWRELYLSNKKGTLSPFITGANSIGKLEWAADNSTLFFLASRQGDKYISLYAIPVNGGEARKVLHHRGDIHGFTVNKKQTQLLFWGTESIQQSSQNEMQNQLVSKVFEEAGDINKLWSLDLTSNEYIPRPIPISEHIIDAMYHPNEDSLIIQASPSALVDDITMGKALFLADMLGQKKHSFEHVGKMGKLRLSPNGKYIAVIAANDHQDPSEGRLLVAKINSSKLTNLTPQLQGQIEDFTWLSNDKVAVVIHQDTESYLATIRVDKSQPSIKKTLRNSGIISKISASEDGNQLALVINTAEHPKELYWYNKRVIQRITNSNKWLKKKVFSNQRSVTFDARDKQKIQGILITPNNTAKLPAPLIIIVHGGPESHVSNGWLNRYSAPAHYAASQGFVVFFPNYRGSTDRGVAFSKLGQNDYAGKEFDDLVDAKEYLVAQGLVDAKRVGITGTSYGGYAAAWAATKLTKHFAASVSGMGIANQISKFGTTDIPTEMIQLHSLQAPWENWQWMLERSPIFYSTEAKTPLLIMHGEQDSRVHYSQSMELYRYLKLQKRAPVRLVLYPDEGHGFRGTAAKLDYSERLMRWMNHFLMQQQSELPEHSLVNTDN